MSTASTPQISDSAPMDAEATAYDRAHVSIYLRLLDAAAEGASWEEVSRVVLGIDPAAAPQRARATYESHLARARWLTASGYRDLLRSSD